MRIKITRTYANNWIIVGTVWNKTTKHPEEKLNVTFRNKDERFRREALLMCKGVLTVYFHQCKQLKKEGDEVTFDDRGFFKKFPLDRWGISPGKGR